MTRLIAILALAALLAWFAGSVASSAADVLRQHNARVIAAGA